MLCGAVVTASGWSERTVRSAKVNWRRLICGRSVGFGAIPDPGRAGSTPWPLQGPVVASCGSGRPKVSSSVMARISKQSQITAVARPPSRRDNRPPPSDAAAQRPSVDTHPVGQVIVLDVAGPLSDVVEELDHAIRLALAQGPRGVACDMTRVVEVSAPGALRRLASAGRHPRDWPGVPVAVTCLGRRGGQTLRTNPLGGHLMVTRIPATGPVRDPAGRPPRCRVAASCAAPDRAASLPRPCQPNPAGVAAEPADPRRLPRRQRARHQRDDPRRHRHRPDPRRAPRVRPDCGSGPQP